MFTGSVFMAEVLRGYANSGCSRLPLAILELAVLELEQRQQQDPEPQVLAALECLSGRLSVLCKARAEEEPAVEGRDSNAGTSLVMVEFPDSESSPPKRPSPSVTTVDKVLEGNREGAHSAEFPLTTMNQAHVPQADEGQESTSMSYERSKRELRQYVNLFNRLDIDKNGSLGISELRVFLRDSGFSKKEIQQFAIKVDTSGDGVINRTEFMDALDSPEMGPMLRRLAALGSSDDKVKTYLCMLRQSSAARVFWDTVCSCVLMCVAIVEPLLVAFPRLGKSNVFHGIGIFIDVLFLSGVVLNFRTGVYAADGFEVMDPWAVAKHYLRTWFFIDLTASLPLALISADNRAQLTLLRLLKFWKLIRVLKAMRITQTFRNAMNTDIPIEVSDWARENKIGKFLPLLLVLLAVMLASHWLACFMLFSGDGFLRDYQDVSGDMFSEFVAAYYWGFTTISTVGYGDITPGSTFERVYSIFAMSIGGAVYGYFIAEFTSMVYEDKMDEVHTWLQFHQFPKDLQRRTRRYFERYLRMTTYVDDASMLSVLSPDLQAALSEHMVTAEVRNLPLFAHVPTGVVSRLASILQPMEVGACEKIVARGEIGSAMYVVSRGEVSLEPGGAESYQALARWGSSTTITLETGDSFGEELLLNPGDLYTYSAIAQTSVTLQKLGIGALRSEIQCFPKVFQQVLANAEHLRAEGCMPLPARPFKAEVLDLLRELQHLKNELGTRRKERQATQRQRLKTVNYRGPSI